jgi:hypothetical protein
MDRTREPDAVLDKIPLACPERGRLYIDYKQRRLCRQCYFVQPYPVPKAWFDENFLTP